MSRTKSKSKLWVSTCSPRQRQLLTAWRNHNPLPALQCSMTAVPSSVFPLTRSVGVSTCSRFHQIVAEQSSIDNISICNKFKSENFHIVHFVTWVYLTITPLWKTQTTNISINVMKKWDVECTNSSIRALIIQLNQTKRLSTLKRWV